MAGVAPDDTALAAALATGEPDGLAGVYSVYADRLYTYAVSQTRDPDAAADAVSDTFLLARDRIDQLRDPSKLRSWLYAICRNECTRHHRRAAHVARFEEAGPMSDPTIDLDRGLAAADAAALVDDVLPALNQGDREVLELALRHELATDEIGAALGMSTNQASARLSRAKQQFERALGALVIFRVGGWDCDELTVIIEGAPFSPLTRKRVARHVEACDDCGHRRAALVSDLSASYGWPLQSAPAGLAARVLGATAADVAAGAGSPAGSDGWPVAVGQTGSRSSARTMGLVAATVAAVALLLGLGATALGGPQPVPAPVGAPSTGAAAPPTGAAAPSTADAPQAATNRQPDDTIAVAPVADDPPAAVGPQVAPSAPPPSTAESTPAIGGLAVDAAQSEAPAAQANQPESATTLPAADSPAFAAPADQPAPDQPAATAPDPTPPDPTPMSAPNTGPGAAPSTPAAAPFPDVSIYLPPQLMTGTQAPLVGATPAATSVYQVPVPD
ncbi:MAG: sigma-70 family RNA polymerase sigma factor [Candidatus Nanopelagicales bacterium]